jgi:hypothetical protein
LVDDPASVRTSDIAVAEADPAVLVAVPTDAVMERLAPRLRRLVDARAQVGDEHGVVRLLDVALRHVARLEPWPRFAAALRSRRNAALTFGILHGRIDLAAVTLSRGRVYQIVHGTLYRWGLARFPAVLAGWRAAYDRARRIAFHRAERRRARADARRPAPPARPAAPEAAPPAWLATVDRVPDPADWLRILSSVRPISPTPGRAV